MTCLEYITVDKMMGKITGDKHYRGKVCFIKRSSDYVIYGFQCPQFLKNGKEKGLDPNMG